MKMKAWALSDGSLQSILSLTCLARLYDLRVQFTHIQKIVHTKLEIPFLVPNCPIVSLNFSSELIHIHKDSRFRTVLLVLTPLALGLFSSGLMVICLPHYTAAFQMQYQWRNILLRSSGCLGIVFRHFMVPKYIHPTCLLCRTVPTSSICF